MMLGIIAAGAIGLAAIAGVAIWLLSSVDKRDSAKTDDSKPAASTPAKKAGSASCWWNVPGVDRDQPPGLE